MSPRWYNILKAAALIWIPALGTLIFTLGSIWSWSWTENAIGSIMAFDTFLGALLGYGGRNISTGGAAYAGKLLITQGPVKDVYSIDVGDKLDQIPYMKEVRLKVEEMGKADDSSSVQRVEGPGVGSGEVGH